MKYTVGDILDRYSILILYKRYTDTMDLELKKYEKEYKKLLDKGLPSDIIQDFVDINSEIWNLEADIRNCVEMPLEELGLRAIQIREFNKVRVRLKNKVAKKYGGFQEANINHRIE